MGGLFVLDSTNSHAASLANIINKTQNKNCPLEGTTGVFDVIG